MSTNTGSPVKANVGIPTIVIAAIALLAVIGFLGYQVMTPKVYAPPAPPARATNPNEEAFKTWGMQRYKETAGDWSKLSKDDQQRFVTASRGRGEEYFKTFKP